MRRTVLDANVISAVIQRQRNGAQEEYLQVCSTKIKQSMPGTVRARILSNYPKGDNIP